MVRRAYAAALWSEMTGAAQQGQVLDGKYAVEEVLGAGGMGVVVRAHHLQLDERVAIKYLSPEAMQVPEAVARFGREARAATKIKSEHVVRIIDVGQFKTGEPYMVMEYLRGSDLSEIVRQRGPLAAGEAAEYLLQAGEALAEAHALGIVHRDLKPANLFLTQRADGSALIKVLDFGISKLTGGAGSGPDFGLTKTSAMMGSPLYMSPEQMASARDVDARADIWAIGAIYYELVTGVPPFNAETLPQLCAKVLQQEPAPILSLRPDLPPVAVEFVERCLRKNPSERYSDVAELARDLLKLAPRSARLSVERISRIMHPGRPDAAATALPPSSVSPAEAAKPGHATAVSWGETAPEPPVHSRGPWIAAGIVALGLVVAGAVALGGALANSAPPSVATEAASPTAPPRAETSSAPSAAPPVAEPEPEPEASAKPVTGKAKEAARSAKIAPVTAAAPSAKPGTTALPESAPPKPAAAAPPPPAPTIGGRL